MNCVRKSYLRYMLYIRTLICLCSSQGLLHWHYLKDAAASFICTHTSSAIHPNNSRRNRENPFIPRKRYLMCKITTRRGLGSSGAAKCPIPPPAGLGRAVPNSLDQESGQWHPAFRRQVASVHALPTLPPAWKQRQRPRYLMRRVAGVKIISAIIRLHLSQLLLWHSIVQLVPQTENEVGISGTQDMMLLVANYQLTNWNFLYIFKMITSSSTEV